jgi:hypothetical protein
MESSYREVGKFLLIAGIVLTGAGVLMIASGRLPFRLGRLPGDVVYSGRHGTIHFPIVTCILVSLTLTIILWIVSVIRR